MQGDGDDCFDPKRNPALKREVKAARKAKVPENYIARVIQFARQGYTTIEFPVYDTDWDSEAYRPSPARTPTIRCASPTTS